jgi:hypothetical protein
MNQLNPELKRLLRWARDSAPVSAEEAPLGFSRKVVRQWCLSPARDSFGMWQRAISKLIWPATAIVVLGLTLLMIERFAQNSSYDLSPAYQVVSMEIIP